jgi:hypothetical protein
MDAEEETAMQVSQITGMNKPTKPAI